MHQAEPIWSASPLHSLEVHYPYPRSRVSAMTFKFKLSRRIARLRAPLCAAIVLSLVGCNGTDSFTPNSAPAEAGEPGPEAATPSFSVSFAGGIPIGIANPPTTEF